MTTTPKPEPLVERLLADKQMVPMLNNPGISEYRTRPLSKEAAAALEYAEQQNAELRRALEKIASYGVDRHWEGVEVARAALQSTQSEEQK